MIIDDPYNVKGTSVLVPPRRILLRYKIKDILLKNRSYTHSMQPLTKRLPPNFVLSNTAASSSNTAAASEFCTPPRPKSAKRFYPVINSDMVHTGTTSRFPFTEMLTKLHARRELDREDRIIERIEKLGNEGSESHKTSDGTYGPQLQSPPSPDPGHLEERRPHPPNTKYGRPQSASCAMIRQTCATADYNGSSQRKSQEKQHQRPKTAFVRTDYSRSLKDSCDRKSDEGCSSSSFILPSVSPSPNRLSIQSSSMVLSSI